MILKARIWVRNEIISHLCINAVGKVIMGKGAYMKGSKQESKQAKKEGRKGRREGGREEGRKDGRKEGKKEGEKERVGKTQLVSTPGCAP